MTLGQPKTAKSRRNIPLAARGVAALKAHRKRQLEERIRMAGMYEAATSCSPRGPAAS